MKENETNITLYTIHCPACDVLESKLKSKNIEYNAIDDVPTIQTICNQTNLSLLPLLKVDDKIMDFSEAIKWVNNR